MDFDGVLNVSEAADVLGVDERAVRLMASSGELDAIKRGGAWWLSRPSVERRRRQQPGRGRPLSAPMAWSVLLLASDAPDAAAAARQNHHVPRARRWLLTHPLADHVPRLRARAERESFDAHPSELSRLAARPDVMPTGISSAGAVGVHGGRGDVELYAPVGQRQAIVSEHMLEPGDGPVLIRWVPDDLWPSIEGATAPRAAVLIDLLEHSDPRARREAARALKRE